MSNNDPALHDIAESISQMAESTTTADLVRRQGQNKKVKVLSERKLLEWIEALLRQHLAGKEGSFSDTEKEALLRKTQEELARRIQREQAAESERQRVQRELDAAMAQISTATAAQGNTAEIETAIAALKAQLVHSEQVRDDTQQDNYELQDQVQEKLALLSSTIAEKEKLRETVRGQMLRSTALIEGVVGLDSSYYGGRHVEQNPVLDESSDDERFYHDFDIGAKVIETLGADLEKLRDITAKVGGDRAQDQRLLEADLELLQQLKAGSISAIDVAAPVAGLIEALEGARSETESLQHAVSLATGAPANGMISALPDPDGDPAQVIAGATTVAREMAAELSRNRARLAALKQIADEADAARNLGEDELTQAQESIQHVIRSLGVSDPAEAVAAVEALRGDLAAARAEGAAAQADLTRVRQESQAAQAEVLTAHADARRLGDAAAAKARIQATALRGVTEQILAAAKGDDQLADATADLALSMDDFDSSSDLPQQVAIAARALANRKGELAAEIEQTRGDRDQARAEADRALADTDAANRELATARARVEQMRRDADEASIQARTARTEAEQAMSVADHMRAEAARVRTDLEERLRAERRLAEQVAQVCSSDQILASAAGSLTAALAAPRHEDGAAAPVQGELHRAVTAMVARQQGIGQDVQRTRDEAVATRAALADLHQSAARALAQASAGDEGLQEEARRIETALSGLRADEPLPADHHRELVDSLGRLAERSVALAAERDEMAAHGKEIIQALTKQREARETELKELRAEHTRTAAQVADLSRRAQDSEGSTRRLAESLSQLAAATAAGPAVHGLPPTREVEEPRIDLELALSQLPGEGEEGISIPADTADLLAESGKRIAEAVAARQGAAVAALAKAEAEARTLRSEVQEQSSNTARFTNDLGSIRQQLNDARTQLQAAKSGEERLDAELARTLAQLSERERLLAEARDETETAHQEQTAAVTELSLRKAETDGLRSQLSQAQEEVLQALAQLDEHSARGGAAQDNVRDEIGTLRRDLAKTQEAQRRAEGEVAEARERAESAEARLKRQRDELLSRLEERDLVITEKDRILDDTTRGRIDAHGMRSQIETLTAKLAAATERLQDLEASAGEIADGSDVTREMDRMQTERDRLREQKRTLEGDLSEIAGVNEEFKSQLEEKRKELLQLREAVTREVSGERAHNAALREEFAKLKEEVIGLRARLRRLSNSGTGPL